MFGVKTLLSGFSVMALLCVSIVPEKAQAQAAAPALAPATQAAAQAAKATTTAVRAAITSQAIQASVAGAAFSGLASNQALSDLEASLAAHPAFQTSVTKVAEEITKRGESLTLEQANALAGVLKLAITLKESVAFRVNSAQATPYNADELNDAVTVATARGIALKPEELREVASSFYSLLAGNELVNTILGAGLAEGSNGLTLINALTAETGSAVSSPGELIATQFQVLQQVEGSFQTAKALDLARGLRSCANAQAGGR